jgi:hypothetical protein
MFADPIPFDHRRYRTAAAPYRLVTMGCAFTMPFTG